MFILIHTTPLPPPRLSAPLRCATNTIVVVLCTMLLALLLAPTISAFGGVGESSAVLNLDESQLRAVPLFGKPEVSTGRLLVMEEGLAVLRAQREPFAIVSAVGPTRTGKSSVLGRAFFRGDHENIFQPGSGVTSFTSGAWITNRPLEVETADGPIRVLFIDTEGFSGVGGITSRTYEANLFGIVYLMSSAVIFNSMFPVDASTAASLNAHASHALQMLQALKDGKSSVRRKRPRLIWSVQGFNVYNLRNSGMEPEDLLSALRNASKPTGHVHGSEVLGDVATSASAWLVETLFEDQQLVPVRRPHQSDEIVANLGKYESSLLSKEYVHDVDHLREATTRGLHPVHRCKEDGAMVVPVVGCIRRAWAGSEFVRALEGWLKDGFILDQSDLESPSQEDEGESLFKLGERNRAWLDGQCKALNEELRTKFYWYRDETPIHAQQREEAAREVERMMKGFQSAALSRMVESGVFWKHPGKGATLVETQTQQAMLRCGEELTATRRYMEDWARQRETRVQTQRQMLLEAPRPEQIHPNSPLRFVMVAKDSTCIASSAMGNRIAIGGFQTLQVCAEAVSANCECGRGFEYDEGNGGFCGCGRAGTPNTDCMEDAHIDFSFGTNRYLMHNPACLKEVGANARSLFHTAGEAGGSDEPNSEPAHERSTAHTTAQEDQEVAARQTGVAGNAAPAGSGAPAAQGGAATASTAVDVPVDANGASPVLAARKARRVCFDVYD